LTTVVKKKKLKVNQSCPTVSQEWVLLKIHVQLYWKVWIYFKCWLL